MSMDLRQRWVQRRFLDEVSDRLVPGPIRTIRQGMIRAAQQFCFMGYYGDERAARRPDTSRSHAGTDSAAAIALRPDRPRRRPA